MLHMVDIRLLMTDIDRGWRLIAFVHWLVDDDVGVVMVGRLCLATCIDR